LNIEGDYIHNGHEGDTATANLRMDMSDPKLYIVTLNENQHFVVATFEDRSTAKWGDKWPREKSYCGVIEGNRWDHDNIRQGLMQIMRNGAKPYDLAEWMKEYVLPG